MRRGGYQALPTKEEHGVTSSTNTAKQKAQGSPAGSKPFKMSDYKLEDTDFGSLQLQRVPYGAIALAMFLTLVGMASFVLAWLHVTQQILGKKQAEIGFTILGFLTFVPGFYHTRIAYYTWRGYKGYHWDLIPS